jgi:hypothetical protein
MPNAAPVRVRGFTTMEKANASLCREVEEFFGGVAARGPSPDYLAATGTCQFNVSGVGSWLVCIKHAAVSCAHCTGACDPPPDTVFTSTPDVLLRIHSRDDRLNPRTAVLQGLVVVEGDPTLAWAVICAS